MFLTYYDSFSHNHSAMSVDDWKKNVVSFLSSLCMPLKMNKTICYRINNRFCFTTFNSYHVYTAIYVARYLQIDFRILLWQ